MKVKEFLQTCTINEFKDWLEDVCLDDSIDNIQEGKSFKCIIINSATLEEGEYSYSIIQDRDTINDLHFELKAACSDIFSPFYITDGTRLFIFSDNKQLMDSTAEPIKAIAEFIRASVKEETRKYS